MTVLILARELDPQVDRLVQVLNERRVPVFRTDLAGVEVTAHLFQWFIQPKAFEARVTVVGDRVFAVAIRANSELTRVDWRADYDALDYAVVEPPEAVTAGMLAFLATFGLSFGAFDFLVTPDQEVECAEAQPGRGLRMAGASSQPPHHVSAGRSSRERSQPRCPPTPPN